MGLTRQLKSLIPISQSHSLSFLYPLSRPQSNKHTSLPNSSTKQRERIQRATANIKKMASVSMTMALYPATQNRVQQLISPQSFFKPLPIRSPSKAASFERLKSTARLQVQASLKERAVTGLTAAALTAAMVIPQVAEAAESGVSPSLKNFLLSIVAGGVVLTVIVGAVIGVANFDPVKRS